MFLFFSNYNFDHPDAFDFDLLLYTLKNMKEGLESSIIIKFVNS